MQRRLADPTNRERERNTFIEYALNLGIYLPAAVYKRHRNGDRFLYKLFNAKNVLKPHFNNIYLNT